MLSNRLCATSLGLLVLLLASCQLMPPQTASHSTLGEIAKPAFHLNAAGSEPPELTTFPSLVTPQQFQVVNKPDAKAKFWWIRFVVAKEVLPQPPQTELSGEDEEDDPSELAEEKASLQGPGDGLHKHRVWIPEQGAFKVNLVASGAAENPYEVIDADARDGEATIALSAELLDGFLKLNGPKSKEAKKNKPAVERKLVVSDSLYSVNQTVARTAPGEGKQSWLKLGKRPFPVPGTWSNLDGAKYVMNFTNQGVQQFKMRWYRTKSADKPSYPVGLNEIGPAGGTAELPGIAKLDIPPGALSAPTVVRISQALEAVSHEGICYVPGNAASCQIGNIFVSPIVRLEPLNLKLSVPARLYLANLPEAYQHDPVLVAHYGSKDPLNDPFVFVETVVDPPEIDSFDKITVDTPTMVYEFQYIAKMTHGPPALSGQSGFRVNAAQPQPQFQCPHEIKKVSSTPNYAIGVFSGISQCYSPEEVVAISKYLQEAFLYFSGTLKMKEPKARKIRPNNSLPEMLEFLLVQNVMIPEVDEVTKQFKLGPDGKLNWIELVGAGGLTSNTFTNQTSGIYLGDWAQLRVISSTQCPHPDCIEPPDPVTGLCHWPLCQEPPEPVSTADLPDGAITAAHELFHMFQDADYQNSDQLATEQEYYYREGTASYISPAFIKNPAIYSKLFSSPLDATDIVYPKHIRFLDQLLSVGFESLALKFGGVDSADPYTAASFFTHMGLLHGDQAVADVVGRFGAHMADMNLPTLRANQAIQDVLLAKGDSYQGEYSSFAKDALFKENISLFPEVTNTSVPGKPELLMHDVQLQGVGVSASNVKNVNVAKGEKPIELSVPLASLSSRHLVFSPSFIKRNKLSVCLEQLSPATLSGVDTSASIQSNDYLLAHVVALKNSEGRPLIEGQKQNQGTYLPVAPGACVTVSDFGSEGANKSVALVLANGNWRTQDPITAKIKAYVDPPPPPPPPPGDPCAGAQPSITYVTDLTRETAFMSIDFTFCESSTFDYYAVVTSGSQVERMSLNTKYFFRFPNPVNGVYEFSAGIFTPDYRHIHYILQGNQRVPQNGSGSLQIEAVNRFQPTDIRRSNTRTYGIIPLCCALAPPQ